MLCIITLSRRLSSIPKKQSIDDRYQSKRSAGRIQKGDDFHMHHKESAKKQESTVSAHLTSIVPFLVVYKLHSSIVYYNFLQ